MLSPLKSNKNYIKLVSFSLTKSCSFMLKKILYLSLFSVHMLLLAVSCHSQKEYTITDELVASERSKKEKKARYSYDTSLTEDERKYFAQRLNVSKDEIINERLYNFIKSWEGTKYVWGGESRNGIDCSALVQQLYSYVYKKELPRTAEEMTLDKRLELFRSDQNLREGDLVFFRLNDERIITHVGIYLKNDKFFAANLVGGVEIANLKKQYWKKNFMAAGRFKQE